MRLAEAVRATRIEEPSEVPDAAADLESAHQVRMSRYGAGLGSSPHPRPASQMRRPVYGKSSLSPGRPLAAAARRGVFDAMLKEYGSSRSRRHTPSDVSNANA